MRGSRGGGGGGGARVRTPPLRFVRGGVLCGGLMSRRGGPKVVFILLWYFFLVRSTRQYHTYSVNIWKIRITSTFKGLPLLPSYTLSLVFMIVPFPCSYCLKLHDFRPLTQFSFWGRTPKPPLILLTHFTKIRQSSRMCFAWRKHHAMSYL